MTELIGFLAAFISAVLYGSSFVFVKRIKNPDMIQFHAFMSVGILISAVGIILFSGKTFSISIFGILAGLVWSAGNITAVFAIKHAGLSRGPPAWMGTATALSFLWGILIFREVLSSFLFGIIGILLIILGAPFVSGGNDKASMKGILLALLAGVIFSFFLLPFMLFEIPVEQFFFSAAIGIFISGTVIFAMKMKSLQKDAVSNGILSGILWNVAFFSSLFAVSFLGLAVGVPLTQLALIISVLWGLFVFREVKGRNKVLKIILGAILLFIGGVFLSLAKI